MAEEEPSRVAVLSSTAVFLDREALEPIRFVEPGRQWSGWHVSPDVFNSILAGAGHWHPERA